MGPGADQGGEIGHVGDHVAGQLVGPLGDPVDEGGVDGTRTQLEGSSILCVIEDAGTHAFLLVVQNGSLRVLEADAEQLEPAATARGALSAWMDLLVHAAAGHEARHDDIGVSGDTAAFDSLVDALH